jgi:general secretion pathway protein N
MDRCMDGRRRSVSRRVSIAQASILQVSMAVALCLCASLARAAESPASGDVAVSNPVELQPFPELAATRDKPLFSPTRRPPPKPVAPVARQEPPPPPPPPPSVVVLGIVSENGDGRAAIRAGGKGDKVIRVRAGDDVSGWKVDRVEPRRLVLTQGERSVDFALFGGGAKSVKTAGAAVEQRLRQIRQLRAAPSD